MITLQYIVFICLVVALAAFMSFGAYRSAQILRTWRPAENPLLSSAENIFRLALIALCLGLGYFSSLDFGALGWSMADPWGQIGRGVAWGIGLAVVFRISTQLLIRLTGQRFYSSLVLELILPRNRSEFVGLAFAMFPVVLLEELLYRSLLIGGLAPLLPVWGLVSGVGILFGLLHSPQGIWGMIGAGIGGVLFGALFVSEGSLLLPVVAHYVANIVQIAWVRLANDPIPPRIKTPANDDLPPVHTLTAGEGSTETTLVETTLAENTPAEQPAQDTGCTSPSDTGSVAGSTGKSSASRS